MLPEGFSSSITGLWGIRFCSFWILLIDIVNIVYRSIKQVQTYGKNKTLGDIFKFSAHLETYDCRKLFL